MSFDTNEFYLKSSEEMVETFSELPGALEATLGIAERWRERPSLAKPFRPSQLADALRGLLAAPG